MEDLITVVVPIYNAEKYLREAIESIISQTYKNLEIFLIDDGSSDNSLSILKYYEKIDKRIRVFTQKNIGISMTMKNAVMLSNGKYIARCDSDDINEPNRYEKQLKYLKENNYDMVGCYYRCFGSGDDQIKRSAQFFINQPITNYNDQYIKYCNGGCIVGGSVFSKLDVLRKLDPFYKDYSGIEDVYLYTILHKNGCRIGIIEEALYNYRIHNNNTSLNLSNRRIFIPQYFDTLFGTWYRDKIEKYENIIIIKKREEEELIRDSFEKYFRDLNPKFVNEDNFEYFIENEILNYNPEYSLFFVGAMFFYKTYHILKNRDYKMYENLFMVVDCFWR